MDALFGHACSQQRSLGFVVHLERATHKHFADLLGLHHAAQEVTHFFAVHQAHVDGRFSVFTREHMVQGHAREVAVFQVFQLLFEHGGLQRTVGVQQRKAAEGLARQGRFHDREDGRNAAATGHRQVVALRGGVQGHVKTALGGHHLNGVTHFQAAVNPVGKQPAVHTAHAHAQVGIVHSSADGVGTAHVLAINGGAQREVLALDEAKHLAQLGRHLEGDDDRLGGIRFDSAYAQGMKGNAHDNGFIK